MIKYILMMFVFFQSGMQELLSQEIKFVPLSPYSQLATEKDLKKKAKRGTVRDMVIYGDALMTGRNGVRIDEEKAYKLYKEVFKDKNDALGAYRLAYCEKKKGKLESSIVWLKEAANLGHSHSQFLYGKALYEGNSINKDWSKAITYLKKTYTTNPEAFEMLGLIYSSKKAKNYDIKPSLSIALNYFSRSSLSRKRLLESINTFKKAKNVNAEMPNFIEANFNIGLQNLSEINKFIIALNKLKHFPNSIKSQYIEFVSNSYKSYVLTHESITKEALMQFYDDLRNNKNLSASNDDYRKFYLLMIKKHIDIFDTSEVNNFNSFLKDRNNQELSSLLILDFYKRRLKNISSFNDVSAFFKEIKSTNLGKNNDGIILKILINKINFSDVLEVENYYNVFLSNDFDAIKVDNFVEYFISHNINYKKHDVDTLNKFQLSLKRRNWVLPFLKKSIKKLENIYVDGIDEFSAYYSAFKDRKSMYTQSEINELSSLLKEKFLSKCKDEKILSELKRMSNSYEFPLFSQKELDTKLAEIEKEKNKVNEELISLTKRFQPQGDWLKYKNHLDQLLKKGANINYKNSNGNTPLHIACRSSLWDNFVSTISYENGKNITINNLILVSYLIDRRADVNITNNYGQNSIMIVALKKRSNCNPKWNNCDTWHRLINFLAQAGASLYLRDNKGNTLYDIASEVHKKNKYVLKIKSISNTKLVADKKQVEINAMKVQNPKTGDVIFVCNRGQYCEAVIRDIASEKVKIEFISRCWPKKKDFTWMEYAFESGKTVWWNKKNLYKSANACK